MLNTVKNLFNGDKAIRKFDLKCNEIFIDQLTREDLGLDEKKQIAEAAKRMMANQEKWEEDNADFWYKYGLNEGEVRGIWKGAAALAIGYLIGLMIKK